MTLYEKINENMKEAMKNHDKESLSTIRSTQSVESSGIMSCGKHSWIFPIRTSFGREFVGGWISASVGAWFAQKNCPRRIPSASAENILWNIGKNFSAGLKRRSLAPPPEGVILEVAVNLLRSPSTIRL